MSSNQESKPKPRVLRQVVHYQNLRFYRKSDAVYQLTCIFCQRFLPLCGDRTVDQMIQAARSCKQNIVEGSEDGATSTEMELKLLNVARSSNAELREDYQDYIKRHHLPLWEDGHERFLPMQDYTLNHNDWTDYEQLANKWSVEEFANTCTTLCYQIDTMMNHYLKHLEKIFVEQGGIKERMYAVRTGYRLEQDEKLHNLEAENSKLKGENAALKSENAGVKAEAERWKGKYADLRNRALNAYNLQQEEIKKLKQQLGEKV